MKYLKPLRKDKGVAGIEILIEVVIGLFILGVLIFCITLMGSEIEDQDSLQSTVTETFTNITTNSEMTDNSSVTSPVYPTVLNPAVTDCALTITYATNRTGAYTVIPATNYTISGCYIRHTPGSASVSWNNTLWNLSGSWVYSAPDSSATIINDTYQSIGDVVDWFPIIIIFGAIVVLILLTVLIIRTVKTSGYGGGGGGSYGGTDTA